MGDNLMPNGLSRGFKGAGSVSRPLMSRPGRRHRTRRALRLGARTKNKARLSGVDNELPRLPEQIAPQGTVVRQQTLKLLDGLDAQVIRFSERTACQTPIGFRHAICLDPKVRVDILV